MARLLIGNVKGPQGPQGIQGIQGPIGPAGPQGPLPPLVSDLLATEAGKAALDAVVGKLLDDKIKKNSDALAQLNSEAFSNYKSFQGIDFNTIKKSGIYSDGSKPSSSGCKNYPVDETGMLIVFVSGYVYVQMYFAYNAASLHIRAQYIFESWSSWYSVSLT